LGARSPRCIDRTVALNHHLAKRLPALQ
jgi:hypothetical protein